MENLIFYNTRSLRQTENSIANDTIAWNLFDVADSIILKFAADVLLCISFYKNIRIHLLFDHEIVNFTLLW